MEAVLGVAHAAPGLAEVTQAREMLTRLVPDIRKTADLVAEISAACREQDVGAEQVNTAIQQLDKVTQQNASASEQMSATSEELAAQAEQLQSSIAYFRLDQDETGRSTARPMPKCGLPKAADWRAHRAGRSRSWCRRSAAPARR